MLKIKDKYLNNRVSKGGNVYHLTEDLTQRALKYIKNTVSSEYITQVEEKPYKSKSKKKSKKKKKYNSFDGLDKINKEVKDYKSNDKEDLSE